MFKVSTGEWVKIKAHQTWWACVALKLRNLLQMSNKNVFMVQVEAARLQPLRWDQQESNQVHLLKYFPQI